ncbi:hypothetical protein [Streptomyces sp. NPDC005486]|uniref:hypothetical protein n=1 Tax=Streptomyces sp. NPDC005486 TaxID=3155345 RepID=UPI0033B2114A
MLVVYVQRRYFRLSIEPWDKPLKVQAPTLSHEVFQIVKNVLKEVLSEPEPEEGCGESHSTTMLCDVQGGTVAIGPLGAGKGGAGKLAPQLKGAPEAYVNRHGELTNGTYTVSCRAILKHLPGSAGSTKSVFLAGVNADKGVLDAAAHADAYGMWIGNKVKVYVESGPVGIVGRAGELTSYINIYRNSNKTVHGSPGGAP